MRVLRKITGVSRLDHIRNETLRERLGLERVLKKVERRRECWKEKVESRKGSVVEKVLTGEGVGKRPRGRPRSKAVERSLLREHNYRLYMICGICSSAF